VARQAGEVGIDSIPRLVGRHEAHVAIAIGVGGVVASRGQQFDERALVVAEPKHSFDRLRQSGTSAVCGGSLKVKTGKVEGAIRRWLQLVEPMDPRSTSPTDGGGLHFYGGGCRREIVAMTEWAMPQPMGTGILLQKSTENEQLSEEARELFRPQRPTLRTEQRPPTVEYAVESLDRGFRRALGGKQNVYAQLGEQVIEVIWKTFEVRIRLIDLRVLQGSLAQPEYRPVQAGPNLLTRADRYQEVAVAVVIDAHGQGSMVGAHG
jgi:hypothetical protein